MTPGSPKELSSLESHGRRQPLIAFFCATYLRPEMHHVYRQITALEDFSRLVVAQKIEHLDGFPFDPIIQLPKSPWRWWARLRERSMGQPPWQISQKEIAKLLEILRDRDASILHIFFGTFAIHLLPLLQQCPIPIVVSFHGADVGGIMLSQRYREPRMKLFETATLITCRSLHLADQLKHLGCPPEKIRLQRTVLPQLQFHQHFPPQDGHWKILQAGRLIAKKGLHTTLHAFALFREKYPASLTIAGEGPLKEELEQLTHKLNLSAFVRFLGFQTQESLQQLFANHSIFLHPSESTVDGDVEGIPNALLEALASGIPCLATRHGGIPEVLQDGRDGLLVEERRPDALACAMLRLAQDTVLYSQLSRTGAESVRRHFAKQYSDLAAPYFSLLPQSK